MNSILKMILLLGASVLLVMGCSSKQEITSDFEGTWLAEEIAPYKADPQPQFICDRLETLNGKRELSIDGYEISKNGHVNDFGVEESAPTLWKVWNDGVTYDNYILANKDTLDGAKDLVSHRMEKITANKIATIWTMKRTNGTLFDSKLIFIRMNDDEIVRIKDTVRNCP